MQRVRTIHCDVRHYRVGGDLPGVTDCVSCAVEVTRLQLRQDLVEQATPELRAAKLQPRERGGQTFSTDVLTEA